MINKTKSFPLLRGNVAECDKGELKKSYHSKNYTQRAFNNAKQLRKKEQTTEAEKLLWYYLKNRQMNNCRFRKQVAIGNYIVDFLCPKKKLIIELDGGQHNEDKNIIYDNKRTKYLNNLGYKVIRFWDNNIFKNMNNVLESIYIELNNLSTPPSLWDTSPQSREGLVTKIKGSINAILNS